MSIEKVEAEAQAAYDAVKNKYGAIRRWLVAHPGASATIITAETLAIAAAGIARLLGYL